VCGNQVGTQHTNTSVSPSCVQFVLSLRPTTQSPHYSPTKPSISASPQTKKRHFSKMLTRFNAKVTTPNSMRDTFVSGGVVTLFHCSIPLAGWPLRCPSLCLHVCVCVCVCVCNSGGITHTHTHTQIYNTHICFFVHISWCLLSSKFSISQSKNWMRIPHKHTHTHTQKFLMTQSFHR
jgi:hypothetical protein